MSARLENNLSKSGIPFLNSVIQLSKLAMQLSMSGIHLKHLPMSGKSGKHLQQFKSSGMHLLRSGQQLQHASHSLSMSADEIISSDPALVV
jgi:hypothetical protein